MLTPKDIYKEIDHVTLLNVSNFFLRNTVLPNHLDARHQHGDTYLLRAMYQVSCVPSKDPRLEDAIKTVNYLISDHSSLCAMTNPNKLFKTPLSYAANNRALLRFCEPICLALGEQLKNEDQALRINLLVGALLQGKARMTAALTKAGTSLRAALCTIVAAHRYTDPGVQLALSQLAGVVNKPDKEGKTALFYATTPEQILALIRMGAKVTHQDNKGRTPLFYATTLAVAQALLYEDTAMTADTQPKPRININHQDNSGHTALHLAASPDIAEYLCQQPGISLTLVTTKGKTALHLAFQRTVVANEKEQQADQKEQKKETAISFALQKHYRVSPDQKKRDRYFFYTMATLSVKRSWGYITVTGNFS